MAQLIKFVYGHDGIKEKLIKLTDTLNLASSYIFDGAEGVGKKKLILAWLQILFCEASNRPCGLCSSCLKVESGHHPSILTIQTEDAVIKTQAADQILSYLSLKSVSKFRFIIIDQAEKMSAVVSNKLLKSVEEPMPGTHFIFITSAYEKLLLTIRSRSQRVRFQNLKEEELKKIFPLASIWSLKNALGSTKSLVSNKDLQSSFDESFQQAFEALWLPQNTISEDFRSWFKVAENSETIIDCLTNWCYNQLSSKIESSPFPELIEPENEVEKSCYHKLNEFDQHQLSKLFFLVQDWKKQLEQRLDPLLTAEKFFFQWHEYNQRV